MNEMIYILTKKISRMALTDNIKKYKLKWYYTIKTLSNNEQKNYFPYLTEKGKLINKTKYVKSNNIYIIY